jgi:competence protein ComEC
MEKMKNIKLYTLSLLFCVNFVVWYAVFAEQRDFLTVAFLDVGQGDAVFIETPDGKQILIDGGPNNSVLRQLTKVMPFYDRSIDMIILTHPDKDHLEGLVSVLENYEIDFVLESGVNSDSNEYTEFEKIVSEKNIKKVLARQGMNIPLCKNEKNCQNYFEILFPVGDVSEFETNTASVVLKLVYGKNSFLFTGDSPQAIEKYLAESFGKELDIDVLKLGHHGSKTSTSDIFLGFTNPEYVVASVGKNNSYGHPHKEILDLLKQFEIDLLRTDNIGTIIFESDGQSLKIRN